MNEKKEVNPIWFGMDSCELVTDKEIALYEHKQGIEMPVEYTEFIIRYGGGYFAFTKIFSLANNSEWNIESLNEKFVKIKDFIAISDNGAGDFYGFKVIDGKCESQIYVYDHENGIIESTKYKDLFEYLVGVGLRSD